MINTQKAILIYNKTASFNLNSLNANVKSKIEKISRVDPTTGNAFQVWAPNLLPTPLINFSALSCGNIYIIESTNTTTFPYQLTNDGLDDGLRSANDYDKNICSGVTPTPVPTSTGVTPTPTNTLLPTPTPTPIIPLVIFIANELNEGVPPQNGQNNYISTGGGVTPNSGQVVYGSFSAYCNRAVLTYPYKSGSSDGITGGMIAIKAETTPGSGNFDKVLGAFNMEARYYASTSGGDDGVEVTYKCGCTVHKGKVRTTKDENAEINFQFITDQCPPTPTPVSTPTPTPTKTPTPTPTKTPTPTPTKTPTPTPTSVNLVSMVASSPNLELGNPCTPGVICPPGAQWSPDCCGNTGKIEYIATDSLGHLEYQTIRQNSTLSFTRQYFRQDLQATLVAGQNTVTLTSGTIPVPLQSNPNGEPINSVLYKVSGSGSFGLNAKISSITNSTTFTVDKNHTTSGSITFSILQLLREQPKVVYLKLSDGSYYGFITIYSRQYDTGTLEIFEGNTKYTSSFTPNINGDVILT